jgi:hypothetical protein
MVSFIDAHRDDYGVEPICTELPIAPSTDCEAKARARDPARVPDRVRRDAEFCEHIRRVWQANYCAYGTPKVWKQLNRELRWGQCSLSDRSARLRIDRLQIGESPTKARTGALAHTSNGRPT